MPAIGTHIIEQTKNVFNVDGEQTSAPMMDFTSTYPIYLFAVNDQGSVQYPASVRIFYCKIYDNETLIRDYLPCISPNGEAGLYDLVSDQFYGNSGTGTFLPGPPNISLPDGYKQLEYIESSDTQQIDTGVKPTQKTSISLQFAPTNLSETEWWFGVRSSARTNMFGIYSEDATTVYDFWGSSTKTATVPSLSGSTVAVSKKNGITRLTYDGNVQTIENPSSDFSSDLNLYLFTANLGGTIATTTRASGKLYHCDIYEDGTLIRNYVPCQAPGGAVGLYDLVNGQFYGNAGTGEFVAGPEVSWPEIPEPEPTLDPYTWYEIDVPTVSAMAAYLANVVALREVLTLPENTAEVPADMAGLTLAEANAIEEILLVIEGYLTALASVFRRCGAAICGGAGFYFKN